MNIKNPLLLLPIFLLCFNTFSINIHVATTGNNTNGDGSISNPLATKAKAATIVNAGDTIQIHSGTYRNWDFGNGDIWVGGNAVYLANINGTSNAPIVFQAYLNDSVTIEFDHSYGFFINNCSHLKFSGLLINGIGNNISLNEAEDAWGLYKRTSDGVIGDLETDMGINYTDESLIGTQVTKPIIPAFQKPGYYNGIGMLIKNSHHITVENNTVTNTPSCAIRATQSDYIDIINNHVYNNTYWTTQGVGALSVFEAKTLPSGDTNNGIKIRVNGNLIHDNENRIISWINQGIVTFKVDEGAGINIALNRSTYANGYIQAANNVAYNNGTSGIYCEVSDRVIIEHNTVFNNGTNVTGDQGGIGIRESDDVTIRNNIAVSRDNKFALGITSQPVTNLTVESNLIWNNNGSAISRFIDEGWTENDPYFENQNDYNFNLSNSSPAIDSGSNNSSISIDLDGNVRLDDKPDIGAYEYSIITSLNKSDNNNITFYPNPVNDYLIINSDSPVKKVTLTNNMGDENEVLLLNKKLNTSNLTKGYYILKVETTSNIQFHKILKL